MNNSTEFYEALREAVAEQWNNHACLGYLIMALEDIELPPDKIESAVSAAQSAFDDISTEEAAAYYMESRF